VGSGARLYAPNLLEGSFCELRLYGVLRNSLPRRIATLHTKIVHLRDVLTDAKLLFFFLSLRDREGLHLPSERSADVAQVGDFNQRVRDAIRGGSVKCAN
jgi:hypothetical protein